MGLKRSYDIKSKSPILYAPCMGLKSFNVFISDIGNVYAPCMGLKRQSF